MPSRRSSESLSDRLKRLGARDESQRSWKLRPEILLCPNVPKPLHGVAPRIVLGSTWWNKERRAAYASTDFHCTACGVSKYRALFRHWLEGHEIYRIDYALGRATYLETVPLCHACHNFIHDGRLGALLERGECTQSKYDATLRHGQNVLDSAGLARLGYYAGPMAAWQDWRLVIGEAEYPPRFQSYEEWERYWQYGTE